MLNRSRWSSRRAARCLFRLLVSTFVPSGPVIIGLDDTLERRWGAKIAARGIYRDPNRSSHGHFVKASGLRWLSVMILPEIAWAGRIWGLPFLTTLAPSERYASSRRQRHKKLTDWGRQVLLQTARWLPDRPIIGVADSNYAAIDLLNAMRGRVCMITRLRLDQGGSEITGPVAIDHAACGGSTTIKREIRAPGGGHGRRVEDGALGNSAGEPFGVENLVDAAHDDLEQVLRYLRQPDDPHLLVMAEPGQSSGITPLLDLLGHVSDRSTLKIRSG